MYNYLCLRENQYCYAANLAQLPTCLSPALLHKLFEFMHFGNQIILDISLVKTLSSLPTDLLFVLLERWWVKAEKARLFRALRQQREITMTKILTMYELQNLNVRHLQSLQTTIRHELTRSNPGSTERRNALANLENIARMINMRSAVKPPFM